MAWISVDIEADGPIPGDYSMVSFGAVVVESGLERTFYGELKPISEKYVSEALAVSGFSREETLAFEDPAAVMARALDMFGLRLVPLSPVIARRSTSLPQPFNGDPADQIIVATAWDEKAVILTRDRAIRKYPHVRSLW